MLSLIVVKYNLKVRKYPKHDGKYVTVFWKTDHLRTRTEIHFLPVNDRHTLMHYPETPITRQ